MKILFCSGEAFPFSKTGGLADVAASLPKSLVKAGHEVKIITPFYKSIDKNNLDFKLLGVKTVHMGDVKQDALYYEAVYDGVSYIFVDNKHYFDRDHFYNEPDDAERFIFFNFAILESIPLLNFYPDIIHVNDWQTALIPYLLDQYKKIPGYETIGTLLSIHNLEKQGAYSLTNEKFLNVKNFTYIHLNQVNFLKCGIMRATAVNTVSASYRNEILTKFYGFSLDGPLKARQFQLSGILNGLDFDLYNPKKDHNLYQPYDQASFIEGKAINKSRLLSDLHLKDETLPLVAFIGRFARQKGISLFMDLMPSYLDDPKFNFVIIGAGDSEFEVYFEKLQKMYPDHVHFHHGFDQSLSQKTYAASDLFLMPSLFEPCGLNQLVAMRYGTLPLVRHTGGLIDTVPAYQGNENIGCGFSFNNYDVQEFKKALDIALDTYKNKPVWHNLQRHALLTEHDMNSTTEAYIKLYQSIMEDDL